MSEVGDEYGSLIVYLNEKFQGTDVTVTDAENKYKKEKTWSANVVSRTVGGQLTYAAIFPQLAPGRYFVIAGSLTSSPQATVNVFAGHEAEVDFRNK